jgi:hypothetical protein
MTGFEPADLFLGKEALFLLSYIRVEPSAGFAPAPSSLPGKRPDSGTARACTESLRPGSNGLPAVYKTAALPGELRRHRVLGRIRTAATGVLNAVPLPLGYDDWSRRPVPTRTARLTRARPQPCAAA